MGDQTLAGRSIHSIECDAYHSDEMEDCDCLCPWHSAHVVTPVLTVPTMSVIDGMQPGHKPPPWTWADEAAYLDAQTCCCEGCRCDGGDPGWYQRRIEALMLDAGGWIGRPAMVGHDGIVRDGHHRLVAAWRTAIPEVQIERVRWPLWWQEHPPKGSTDAPLATVDVSAQTEGDSDE